MPGISKAAFKFLKDIEKNNNREWFEKNKPNYKVYQEELKVFAQAVEDGFRNPKTSSIYDYRCKVILHH